MAEQHLNLDAFLARHRLPEAFRRTANEYYLPLAEWVQRRRIDEASGCFFLGINGAQGTGKSTLSNFLAAALHARFNCNVVEISIDDLYLTKAERETLAARVHPLLKTRGVPGTHDVDMGCRLLDTLGHLEAGAAVAVPRFDKAIDDRYPVTDWPRIKGPVDVVILEGWCVGSTAQSAAELTDSVNDLEAREDADHAWREYVNNRLEDRYPALFGKLNALVYLQAPGFDAVYRWRTEQEIKLRERAGRHGDAVFSDDEVIRFVQHFERLTRHNFAHLPQRADAIIDLGMDHQARKLTFQGAD